MPLVPARCPNCGDNIKVDKSKEAAVCPSCGAAYIVEKAINNYGTIVQGHNVTINNVATFDRDSMLSEVLDKLDRSSRAKRERGAKSALETLDVVFKQCGLSKGFLGLREALKFVYAKESACIEVQELKYITDAYLLMMPPTAKVKDTSLSPEQAERLFASWENVVADGWWQLTASLPELLNEELNYAKLSQGLLALLDDISAVLKLIQSPEVRLEPENATHPLHCPSFWAEMARLILEQVSLCYDEEHGLNVKQAQRVYDVADEYRQVKGVFRKKEFSARLTPIHKGGEGVHIHRITITKNYKEYTASASEHSCYRARTETDCSEVNTANCFLGASSGCFVLFIALFLAGGASSDHADHNISLAIKLACIAPFVVYPLLQLVNSGDTARIIHDLHAKWLQSPARGTKAPDMSFEKFEAWLKQPSDSYPDSVSSTVRVISTPTPPVQLLLRPRRRSRRRSRRR